MIPNLKLSESEYDITAEEANSGRQIQDDERKEGSEDPG